MRLRAGLHLVEHHVRDGRGASGDKGVVDGHKTPNSFSRISLRVAGHSGLVADEKLAKKRVE
eukprot:4926047-Pleurochrysis_carterae.AAC.1